jgi:hypothetical protein
MKLYTEEQVREIIERAELNQHLTYGDVLDGIFPIELPSDEEIDKANGYAYYGKPNGGKYIAFNEGAKWMRDKIQGGDK